MRIESLENRTLFAITVQVDYSLDDADFFDDPNRRAVLQSAFDALTARLGDSLAAVTPGGINTYTATIFDPADSIEEVEFTDLAIPADTLRIYVGAQTQPGILGQAAPADVLPNGTAEFNDTVRSRGQVNTEGDDARDFGPIGGSIAFDIAPVGGWYFGTDPGAVGSRVDFFSVAQHELGHILGVGPADSWDAYRNGLRFNGPATLGEFDGSGSVPLANSGHFANSLEDDGQEVAMDPDAAQGQRKPFTSLDFAALDDIGWEIPLTAALDTSSTLAKAGPGNVRFNVTYSHYTNVALNSLGGNDVTITGPNGFSAPGLLVSTSGSGRNVTATYALDAPGGSFDAADAGQYTVSVNQGAVGDSSGNITRAETLGSFGVDIDLPPTASLSSGNITLVGGATHMLTVNYADTFGLDETTIDIADLTVTRDSDGQPLSVFTVSSTGDSLNKTATYMVAAPGGLWDVSDNGTYTVSLAGQQVRDIRSTAADATTLGTFDVTINAVAFSAGNNLTFTDASGDTVTAVLKGPGSGQAIFSGPGNADLAMLVLNNTAVSSALTITAGGAGTPIDELTINGSLKSLIGKNVDLDGEMTASGPVGTVQFRNASGTMSLGSAIGQTLITLAQAKELSILSAAAIKSFKANDWLDDDTVPDALVAPDVLSMVIKGALEADITADTIGKLTVGGALSGAAIRTTGSIAAVTIGSAVSSSIFAGVEPAVTSLPDSVDDFADSTAEIKSLSIKSKAPGSFSDTRIAAPNLGKATLGAIDTSNGQSVFGVAALKIRSVGGVTDTGGSFRRSNLDEPGGSLLVGDFALRLL